MAEREGKTVGEVALVFGASAECHLCGRKFTEGESVLRLSDGHLYCLDECRGPDPILVIVKQ